MCLPGERKRGAGEHRFETGPPRSFPLGFPEQGRRKNETGSYETLK
jgi:hypothetical protein